MSLRLSHTAAPLTPSQLTRQGGREAHMCWSEAAPHGGTSQAMRRHSYAAKLVKSPLIRRPRLERPSHSATNRRTHPQQMHIRTYARTQAGLGKRIDCCRTLASRRGTQLILRCRPATPDARTTSSAPANYMTHQASPPPPNPARPTAHPQRRH